jgi:hypothetical protein
MKYILVKASLSLLSFTGVLFALLHQNHDLTKLRKLLPELAKDVRVLEEENSRLLYEIERFENPKHLLDLAKRPEFCHLHHPYDEEILVVHLPEDKSPKETVSNKKSLTLPLVFAALKKM